VGKEQVLHILSVCSVALGIQRAMRRIAICGLAWPGLACPIQQYFSTLTHKHHGFEEKKKLLNTKSVSIFCTTFV
jgi:hypothetical protein